jgi:hypothetical protein
MVPELAFKRSAAVSVIYTMVPVVNPPGGAVHEKCPPFPVYQVVFEPSHP